MIQKLLYGILIASRKLRHYFDAYNILVVSDFPLTDILHNWDATGRISKWAIELGALTLDFKPRTAINSQALVDFMAEWQENQVEACCQSKPTSEQRQATRGAGRLPGLLVGPSPSVNGPGSGT
jgi:hypothetical protein